MEQRFCIHCGAPVSENMKFCGTCGNLIVRKPPEPPVSQEVMVTPDPVMTPDPAMTPDPVMTPDPAIMQEPAAEPGPTRLLRTGAAYGAAQTTQTGTTYGAAQTTQTGTTYGAAQTFQAAPAYGAAQMYDPAMTYGSAQTSDPAATYGSAQMPDPAATYGSAAAYGAAVMPEPAAEGVSGKKSKVPSGGLTLNFFFVLIGAILIFVAPFLNFLTVSISSESLDYSQSESIALMELLEEAISDEAAPTVMTVVWVITALGAVLMVLFRLLGKRGLSRLGCFILILPTLFYLFMWFVGTDEITDGNTFFHYSSNGIDLYIYSVTTIVALISNIICLIGSFMKVRRFGRKA